MIATIRDLTRFAHVPEDLVTLPRWVLWKRETPKGRDKPTKVPYRPSGYKASSINPRSWSSYSTILETYRDDEAYEGIGFMLGDGWAGCDLDDCIDEGGIIAEWARAIIRKLSTYCEISPSGRGVKMICKGTLPPGRRRTSNGPKIEMYDHARFFTVTGNELRGAA